MNLAQKVGRLKQVSEQASFKIFSFNHGPDNYIVDFSEKNIKIFLEEEYNSVKRKSKKLAKYNKAKAEKVLWVDEDNNELGYGEEGRLRSIEALKK
jgi:hypothetical protein